MPELPAYQRFLAELKRRHVFRVAAVYGATAFVALQVADLLISGLQLSADVMSGVTVIVLVGFPIALAIAWAYERTPAGVERTKDLSDSELDSIARESASKRWPVALAAIAGALLLGSGAWWVLGRDPGSEGRTYDSIAVLPFVDLSGDQANEYLGDGLAEELLNALAGIEGLDVAARTSAFAFKGSSITAREIGDSLGVATVLEGSVRHQPDRLRITAQLIDSETGFHVWSETYDRAPADLLDIQDELTSEIMAALAVQLGDDVESDQPVDWGTEDPEAYDYYLQGRYFWNKRTAGDMRVAVGLFEKAIEADSGFAPAYASIADVFVVPAGWDDGTAEALDKANTYARRALELDPTLAQAHAALGLVHLVELDFRASEQSFVRAIELEPEYATAHQWYAELLAATDRGEQAVSEGRLAVELDPTMIIRWNLARTLYHAGRFEEAVAQAESVALEEPMWQTPSAIILVSANEMLGDYEAVLGLLETLAEPAMYQSILDSLAVLDGPLERTLPLVLAHEFDRVDGQEFAPDSPFDPRPFELGMAARAWTFVDADTALARLAELSELADNAGAGYQWFSIHADPAFAEVRADPRFAELNARFGL